MIRGAFGDLAAAARERIEQIEGTLAFRQKQLEAALEKGSEKADVYRRTVESLEANIGEIRMEAVRAEEAGIGYSPAALLPCSSSPHAGGDAIWSLNAGSPSGCLTAPCQPVWGCGISFLRIQPADHRCDGYPLRFPTLSDLFTDFSRRVRQSA